MALVNGRGAQHGFLEASDVADASVRVGEPGFVDGRLFWVVTPPSSSGNAVVVSCVPGETPRRESPRRESPVDHSVRSRLYGYGATSWCASPVGLVGIEARTQQLCRLSPDGMEPVRGAPPPGATDRLGDPACVPGTSWVLCVRERRVAAAARVTLVAIEVSTGECVELFEAKGLAAEPAVDAAARRVAWLQWPAGTMPWDAAALWVADLDVGPGGPALRSPRRLDGGHACSAGQPTWLPDGSLAYVTEGAGIWQPWCSDPLGVVRRLSGALVEFQRPRWTTCRWLAVGDPGAPLLCAFADADGEHVATLDPDGRLEVIEQPCVRVDGVAADDEHLAWVGATTQEQGAVLMASRASPASLRQLPAFVAAVPRTPAPPSAPIAPEPESFEFVHDGVELAGVRWAPSHGRATEAHAPPLVVAVHPGPTGATDRSYAPLVHLLCSNGFAVASIDYSGSSAHGRRHRERLGGRYGELDVAECTAAAAHLVNAGLADERALFIRGTSAGGTTALLALCGGVFAGAAAWYPASSFADDHEDGFESGYLETLLGKAGASRSPLLRSGSMSGSVLIVQGADDDVIDPADTERLVARLSAHLKDVTSVVVTGEGHGFRTASGRTLALGCELDFYRRLAVAQASPGARYDSSSGAIPQPRPL